MVSMERIEKVRLRGTGQDKLRKFLWCELEVFLAFREWVAIVIGILKGPQSRTNGRNNASSFVSVRSLHIHLFYSREITDK
jgi:hypothetical protein